MADITRQPIFRTTLANDNPVDPANILSFVTVGVMGAAYIINNGPDECWMNFDAMPASATFGNGRKHLKVGESFNLDDIVYTTIGFLCAAAKTAQVEATGLIRPGSSGQGIG